MYGISRDRIMKILQPDDTDVTINNNNTSSYIAKHLFKQMCL